MAQADPPSSLIESMIGQVVVLDLTSRYVCLGTLTQVDLVFYALRDADLHDLRDGQATREIYVNRRFAPANRQMNHQYLLEL